MIFILFILIFIHYHRVYYELTIDHLSMWLDSSVDRALHRYRKVMGSNQLLRGSQISLKEPLVGADACNL